MIDKPIGEVEQQQIDAVKQRIRKMLSELKQMAKSPEVTDQQFLSQLVSRTLESTGAAGCTIWQVNDEGQVAVVHEAGSTSTNAELNSEQLTMHERLVRTVVSSARPTLIEPDARDQNSGEVINPMAFLLLLKPLNDPSLHRHYVIELFQRPDIAPAARTGYMRYLEEIGEIFGSWQARNQLRVQSTQQTRQSQTMDFVKAIHASLDPSEVAYAAANGGRLLAGCDRLSVLTFNGRVCKVLSVSGQDDFDNRSNVVRKQQDIASLVCRTKQPIWLVGQSGDLPRATKDLVDDYLNESHSRTFGVIPIFDGKGDTDEDTETEEVEPVMATGALVLEWFGEDVSELDASENVAVLSDHIGRSLANANEYKSIFLMPLWRAIGKWKWLFTARTVPKTIAASVVALGLLLFFCFFPWAFDMRVQGTLEPVNKQNVYAISSGVISKVHVVHGQKVKKGELLLELRSDQLDYELTQAYGDLEVTKQEKDSAESAALRARNARDGDAARDEYARSITLGEKLIGLKKKIDSLNVQLKQLQIHSPIDGTVVSWDPVRQLTERPVVPQDVVLVVATVGENADEMASGTVTSVGRADWQMELFIPERKYGHVVDAMDELEEGEQLDVTFFSATNPNRKYKGKILRLEGHASEHPTHGSSVRAFASFDPDDQPELYVGAAITAKVHCGQTVVGYAWFHEPIEFIQARLLF